MEKLDKGTYGNSKVAINLAGMLNDLGDPKAIRKVGKIYGRTCKGFDNLARLEVYCKEDRDNKETLMQLWRDAKVNEAKKTKSLPPVISSHLINLITTKYRIARRVSNWLDEDVKKFYVRRNKNRHGGPDG